MATVREFSSVGPCINLGELVKENEKWFWFRDRFDYGKLPEDRKIKRRGKDKYGLLHTCPCVSCRDHVSTQYPNGYEN